MAIHIQRRQFITLLSSAAAWAAPIEALRAPALAQLTAGIGGTAGFPAGRLCVMRFTLT